MLQKNIMSPQTLAHTSRNLCMSIWWNRTWEHTATSEQNITASNRSRTPQMNFISKYDQHKDVMRTCIQRLLHLLVRRIVALTFALCGLCVEQTVHCVCGCVHLSPSDAANNEWVVPFTCDNFSIVFPLVGVLNSNLGAVGFLIWRCAISVCAFMFSKSALCRNAGTYTWQ